ncbi:MAG: hypothetical protein AVDCRST_MAG64-1929, partial [uncultured Phycisphaerae bacterium]
MTLPDGNAQPNHVGKDQPPTPVIRTGPASAEKSPPAIRLVPPSEGGPPAPPQAPSDAPPPPPAPKAAEEKRGPWGRISRAGLGLAHLLVADQVPVAALGVAADHPRVA